jgi:hypothetical protein
LVQILDELQHRLAIGLACARCGRGLGYAAVLPGTAHVVSANRRLPKKERHGGIYDLDPLSAYEGRFEPWIEDADAGLGQVRPSEDPTRATGFAGRRTFECARCGACFVCTEHKLLRLWLDAIVNEEREIRL